MSDAESQASCSHLATVARSTSATSPPAAMVGYFDELSAAIKSGVSDDARLGGIALRHEMEVVGPVPEGYL